MHSMAYPFQDKHIQPAALPKHFPSFISPDTSLSAEDIPPRDIPHRAHDSGGSPSSAIGCISPAGLRRSLNSIPSSYRHDQSTVALITSLHHGILFRDCAKSWCIYQTILQNHPLGSRLISPRLLHSLSALLWKTRPITRQTFLRLTSIVNELRNTGHPIYTWEWNALIHAAGAGFRRTATKDFEAALNIVEEMIAQSLKLQSTQGNVTKKSPVGIVTLNTLLAIASRTRLNRNVQRVLDMLAKRSDVVPDRITHLILLNHYGRNGRLDRLPGCIIQLMQTKSGIGVDGINAILWAYARSGRIDYALQIYERLRFNLTNPGTSRTSPSTHDQKQEGGRHPILSLPHIDLALLPVLPDSITYTTLVQCLAYHGDFTNAISVFWDYVGATTERPPPTRYDDFKFTEERAYAPPVEMYRSLFIGFIRHGVFRSQHQNGSTAEESQNAGIHLFSRHQVAPLSYPPQPPKPPYVTHSSHSSWTLQSLSDLFDNFLEVPRTCHLNDRVLLSSSPPNSRPLVPPQVIYWALVAFSKTTNADKEVMRAAWLRMARAFQLDCRDIPQTSRFPTGRAPPFGDSFILPRDLTGRGRADNKWRPRGRLKRLVEWVESDER